MIERPQIVMLNITNRKQQKRETICLPFFIRLKLTALKYFLKLQFFEFLMCLHKFE